MKVSVFGLGYVGAVSAACLARTGHEIVGVDVSATKVEMFNAGQAPVIEPGLSEMMAEAVAARRLRAITDPVQAVLETDASIVCVGTPSQRNGNLSLSAVEAVCRQIGGALRKKDRPHTVIMRSTVLPGTMRKVVQPILEDVSGLKAGDGFGLAHNPEFLREGTAIHDFDHPPKTVIGAIDKMSAGNTAALYDGIDAPLMVTSIEVSEMVKYADNVWHALKVCFGNEIGNICKASGIDSHEVMDIFCRDTKLNISPYYLKPGFAFGGSCLPKDTRALTYRARELDQTLPVLNAIMDSNRIQIERAVERVIAKGKRRISVLGFSFKAGTDDLRESPQVELIERLIGKGYDLRLYDRNVQLAALTGANRDYIMNAIPHISQLIVGSMDEALAHGDVVIIGNGAPEFREVPRRLKPDQILVDLVRVGGTEHLMDRYDGINW